MARYRLPDFGYVDDSKGRFEDFLNEWNQKTDGFSRDIICKTSSIVLKELADGKNSSGSWGRPEFEFKVTDRDDNPHIFLIECMEDGGNIRIQVWSEYDEYFSVIACVLPLECFCWKELRGWGCIPLSKLN